MAFIQYKKIKNKTYAYEITSYWDKDLKQARKHSKYLGPIDPETKKIMPFIKKINNNKENLILDFGDGYFLYELIKKLEEYIEFLNSSAALFSAAYFNLNASFNSANITA